MAQFNREILSDDEKVRQKAAMECGMYLQALLPKEQLEQLKRDWEEAGGKDKIPWWKFAFDNISVSYKGFERDKELELQNTPEEEMEI